MTQITNNLVREKVFKGQKNYPNMETKDFAMMMRYKLPKGAVMMGQLEGVS